MGRVTQFFIIASLFYLCLGVTIGVLLAIFPGAIVGFLPMHAHTNLLGWVSMMIFAVAYHVLPRFSGRPLYSDRLADMHLILSNIGLIGLIITWPLSRYYLTTFAVRIIFPVFALFYAVASYMFVYNIYKTVFAKE